MSRCLNWDSLKRRELGRRGEPVDRGTVRPKPDDPRWRIRYPREFPVTVTRIEHPMEDS